ncbi:pectinesterase family protein [Paenibacillus tianjinensis]|uniref:pectinesterase family protein n=1 Tax=Paenibacillus tianjinensis TaxID=2810347 RepID=UPI0038CD9C3C
MDFIFGGAAAYFEHCEIRSLKSTNEGSGFITAASTPQGQSFGYVFDECYLTAAEGVSGVYLGRPWRGYARTEFMNCRLGSHILPTGWDNWGNPANETTVCYREYGIADDDKLRERRVPWALLPGEGEACRLKRRSLKGRSSGNSCIAQAITGKEGGDHGAHRRRLLFYILKHAPTWVIPVITADIINHLSRPDLFSLRWQWIELAIVSVVIVQNIPSTYMQQKADTCWSCVRFGTVVVPGSGNYSLILPGLLVFLPCQALLHIINNASDDILYLAGGTLLPKPAVVRIRNLLKCSSPFILELVLIAHVAHPFRSVKVRICQMRIYYVTSKPVRSI